MRPLRAVLLLRISDDKNGEAAGVARQEIDGRRLAERLGWQLGPDETHVIIENDTSAFKRRKIKLPDGSTALRTVRPGFRRCLDMLAAGTADGLLAYDLDRVARDPRDLEDLIDVVEAHRQRIPCESVTGSLRLANDADVTMARVMVAVNNKSSRDTSRRVARTHVQLASEGKPGGGGIRAFGYERDGITVRESEAAVVREMADMMLNGGSLTGVARHLNDKGVPTVRGGQWQSRSVWSILKGPKIAGMRSFHGAVVGEAVWPAILDRDTWDRVQAVISDRATGKNNQLRRWLTGSLWCPLCGSGLSGAAATSRIPARYWCSTPKGGCGKIAVTGIHVEGLIERRVLEYLESPQVVDRLLSLAVTHSSEEVRTQLADDEAQLKDLARMWASRMITLPEYAEARGVIESRMKNAKAFARDAAPRVLRYLLSGDVHERWAGLPARDRREVVLALMPDGFYVMPHTDRRRSRFDPERVVPCPSPGHKLPEGAAGLSPQSPDSPRLD